MNISRLCNFKKFEKKSLKKLMLDTCTKTVFLFNNKRPCQEYQERDQ